MSTTPDGCLICGQENAAERSVIFRDDLWACEICPGFEVPGWIVFRSRRHVIGWPGLSREQQATVGRRIADVVSALSEVTGAEKTYVLTFGEANPHFHALVASRGEDVPVESRVGGIYNLLKDRVDVERSHELVPALRAAYRRFAAAD